MRTPITIITGPLGSGKTTLLRHLLSAVSKRLAIVMNEFGEIAIDSKIIEGKNVRLTELGGGCVCCSLIGEFEAAVNEIIDTAQPEHIVLETTGVAEPGAVIADIEQNLPRVWLDGTVSVMDADGLLAYPSIGHTTRLQIESADLLLLNKIDLVSERDLKPLEEQLRRINHVALVVQTRRCRVDADLLFGIEREVKAQPPRHVHQPEFESVSYSSPLIFDRDKFEQFVSNLPSEVYRAKGFVRFADGAQLFNFVGRRSEFEPFHHDKTELVFIGKRLKAQKQVLLSRLKDCEKSHASRVTPQVS